LLISKQYATFITIKEFKFFPPMSLHWDFPGEVSNAIIEFSNKSNFSLELAIYQMIAVNCQHLLFKFMNSISKVEFLKLVYLLKKTNIKTISIYINSNIIDFNEISLIETIDTFKPIKDIILFKSEFELHKNRNVSYNTEAFDFLMSDNNCGLVDKRYFSVYFPLFTESQLHNTCLNRKICIDANGEIKNCPGMMQSFGNIKDTTLKEALEKPGFKDLWFICKDKIDVCKDCEFRHMCTDCRAYIKDPENIYSQPAKCSYNPYIAKWQGEEGYVPVEDCGTYSKETGFMVDKKKVNKLNKILWTL
jgi:SPASM domain peptide maturase of grasp-with-spasm system